MRANARAIASSDAGRRTEKIRGRTRDLGDRRGEQPLGRRALAELMVDRDAVPDPVRARGRALVREGDGVRAVDGGGEQREHADDRGDRDVAVERAGGVGNPADGGRSSASRADAAAGDPQRSPRSAAGRPTENRVDTSPACRAISIATAESFPPPTGTRTRASSLRRAAGRTPARAAARGNDGAGSAGSSLTTANSPRPSE